MRGHFAVAGMLPARSARLGVIVFVESVSIGVGIVGREEASVAVAAPGEAVTESPDGEARITEAPERWDDADMARAESTRTPASVTSPHRGPCVALSQGEHEAPREDHRQEATTSMMSCD